VLVLRDKNGNERVALLLNSDGESVGDAVLGWVGTAVEVRGKLRGIGGLLTLEVKPGSIRRLLPWE
jgi:hypothetical protein